jgi:hypothetical protein
MHLFGETDLKKTFKILEFSYQNVISFSKQMHIKFF